MRLIKMLGLAAMAAMVATAFVGASSASATVNSIVLCKTAELVCESPYENPTEIHAEAKNPKLLSKIGNVICDDSLALLTLLNKLAKLIEGHLLALTFLGNCKLEGTEITCTVEVTELGGLSFEATENETEKLLANVTAIPLEEKETKAKVVCGFVFNCTFEASSATKLVAHSDAEGHLLLLATEAPLKGSGFACPSEAKWDATYHAVNLDEELTLKTGLWIEG